MENRQAFSHLLLWQQLLGHFFLPSGATPNTWTSHSPFTLIRQSFFFVLSSFTVPFSICCEPSKVIYLKLLHCCELKWYRIAVWSGLEALYMASGAGWGWESTAVIRQQLNSLSRHWRRKQCDVQWYLLCWLSWQTIQQHAKLSATIQWFISMSRTSKFHF